MSIMNLGARLAALVLGGGVFGAGLADVAHSLVLARPGNNVDAPVGSGVVAGIGLSLLLIGMLRREE